MRSLGAVTLVAVLAGVLLAGCSGSPSKEAAAGAPGPAPGKGAIDGVVVDDAIRPVAGAQVGLTGSGAGSNATTGADGTFHFTDLAPGSYLLKATHILYVATQSTVLVDADQATTAKLQMQRLSTQEPFHETMKFDGFLQCAWAVEGAASSTCVNDYTHFVGLGYTCPQCEHLVDNRGTTYPLGGGWQTQVYEVVWDPSAQGTSPEMRITVSHFPRPASHWYCSGTGPSPILLRMEVGVECEDQQSDPKLVPAEGEANMTMFMAAKAPDGGAPVAMAVSQSFTVFMNFFYFGRAPEGWSFVKGDEFPF